MVYTSRTDNYFFECSGICLTFYSEVESALDGKGHLMVSPTVKTPHGNSLWLTG